MSLADELLADFDGDEDDGGYYDSSHLPGEGGSGDGGGPSTSGLGYISEESMDIDVSSSIRKFATVCDSDELQKVMREIEKRTGENNADNKKTFDGPVEEHPENKLTVEANNLTVAIDDDINIIHKYVKDRYNRRFPELDSLVPMPLEYLMTVKELGNDLYKAKNNETLRKFLTQDTIMILSVSASTTKGTLLSADELSAVIEACDMAIELNTRKAKIIEFVESQMSSSIRKLATVYDSKELKRVMDEIEKRAGENGDIFNKGTLDGQLEQHPEYKLIVDANNLTVAIDDDINIIHKYVKDKYSRRFPELDSLIPIPLEYLMTVKELGNDLNKAKNNETLQNFLTQATIMILSVSASTTQGTQLSVDELNAVIEACDMAIELNARKAKIFEFVESRMSFIAPNVSAIVGANIAAKLMGLAGGLTNLSKMPACNLEVLGSQKRTLAGFSSTQILPHTGFVFQTDIVQETPPDFRRKVAHLVANKCTIAARIDACHSSQDGSQGRVFREKIERALDKLLEPPPVKQVKPLPPPIDLARKKRGGKRVRRIKERMAMTEFRKQINRMNFGEIEDDAYQDDLGFTTGQIGKSSIGRIRAPQIDEKTKVRISKTLQKNLQKTSVYGGTTSIKRQISGTASSVAFTPLKGIEIVAPHAAESKGANNSGKYFSSTSGFLSVVKKTT